MQEGGVVMDVVTPEEAHIAEDGGSFSNGTGESPS